MDPDYDVKIVGGKRRVIWRFNSPNTQSRTGGQHSVLPPIPTSGGEVQRDEIHIRRQLNTFLRGYSENQLNSLHADLRDRSILSTEVFTAIAARHRLPIPDNLLKSLCERFATNFSPTNIQSDKLIDYLIQCKQLGDQVLNFDRRATTTSSLPRSFSEQHEARLVWDLERELVGDNTRLDNFRRHAYELDNLRRGVLNREQFEVLLERSNISLSPEFLTRLLRHCDHQGYGLYSINDFLSFLERATVENQILFTPSERKVIRAKTPRIPLAPLLPHQGFVNNSSTRSPRLETPLVKEDWLSKFNRMASALLNTPQEIPGFLTRDYVTNLTDTYNVVYNLQLDALQIEDAVNNSSDIGNSQIDINSYISYLKRAHLVQHYT